MGNSKPSSKQVYRRLLGYLKPHRRLLIVSMFATLIFGSTDGVIPYLLKRILDDVFSQQNKQMLWYLSAAIMVFAIFRGAFGFMQRYLSTTLGLVIIRDIRNAIADQFLRLGAVFYSRNSTGSLISRMTNDTLLVKNALTEGTVNVIGDCIRVVALLIAAFSLDPVLASITFIGFPLGIIPVIRFGKRVKRLSYVAQNQLGGLTSILHEIIIGHKVVQAFSMEEYERDRFHSENENHTKTFERAAKYAALATPTNEVLASLAIVGVILYGGYSVIGGVRTQGQFIAFLTAMFLLYEPLKKLGRVNGVIQGGVASAERIFELLDQEPDVLDLPNASTIATNAPRIEYRKVGFKYPETGDTRANPGDASVSTARPFSLQDISFVIEPGQTLALVGVSGGGKSTIANFLPRFYDPTSGEIFINNTNIKEVTLSSLRRSLSIVSQHTFLFNDSVLHNIMYGRMDASEAEVIAAAKAANAHDFIVDLPAAYKTEIGEQGYRLSGGQRARIALARALLKNAPILVLDEATANLDSESEELVYAAIDRLMENRTVLVIAHRFATIRRADKIAVVSNGRIVEFGNHLSLLEKNGEYAKLYRLQFGADGERHLAHSATC